MPNGDKPEKYEQEEKIHMIGNLTLIDKQLNIGFSNGWFCQKRKHVLCALFGQEIEMKDGKKKKYENSVIFPGTRWVFLREFDNENTQKEWNMNDKEKYGDAIAQTIFDYLASNTGE